MAHDVLGAGQAPEERNLALQEFHFKQICRVRIGGQPKNCHFTNIVSANDNYGLIAVGHTSGIIIVSTASILERDASVTDKVNTILDDVDVIGDIILTSEPKHVGFNATGFVLAVVCHSPLNTVFFYDVRAFRRTKRPEPFMRSGLGAGQGIFVTDLRWNPEEGDVFAACLSNGSLVIAKCNFPGQIDIQELPSEVTSSTCICWSPKGKQLVAGRADGCLVQYSKTFEVKAIVAAPPRLSNLVALSVLWQSTYVFFAAYGERNENLSDVQPTLVGVHLTKEGQVAACVNYGDLCFGSSDTGQSCGYYILQIPKWDVIFGLSATSVNSCILGSTVVGQAWPWQQWTLDDSGQISMPLHQVDDGDTYPRGLALTVAAVNDIPGPGPGQSYPASPIIFILSSEGLLMPYHVINCLPGLPSITKQPEPLSAGGPEYPRTTTASVAVSRDTTALQAPGPSDNLGLGKMPFGKIAPSSVVPVITQNESTSKLGSLVPAMPSSSSFFQKALPSSENNPGLLTLPNTPSKFPAITKEPLLTKGPVAAGESSQKFPGQLDEKVAALPRSAVSGSPLEQEPAATSADGLYTKAIMEEVADFRKSLAALQSSFKKELNISDIIGTKDEFLNLRKGISDIFDGSKSIQATVQSCSSDVYELKLQVLETFTLLEQCRSLQRCYEHPEYRDLLKSRPVDPFLKSKAQEVEKLYYSVQRSLEDLAQRVDDDWAEMVKQQLPISTGALSSNLGQVKARQPATGQQALDFNNRIYAATKTTELILHSQEALVEDLSKRVKAMHLSSSACSGGRSSVRSTRGHVKTARDLLTSETGASGVDLASSTSEVTASVGRPRQLSPTAASLLSRYLRSRNVVGLSATAPASLSLSKVVAAEKLKTQLKALRKPLQGEPEGKSAVVQACLSAHLPVEQGTSVNRNDVGKHAVAGTHVSLLRAALPLEPSSEVPTRPQTVTAQIGDLQAKTSANMVLTSSVVPSSGAGAVPSPSPGAQLPVPSCRAERQAAASATVDSLRSFACPVPPASKSLTAGSTSATGGPAAFKLVTPASGSQLALGAAATGGPSSAFSIFNSGTGGLSSAAGGKTVPTEKSAQGCLPLLASMSQKSDVVGRPAAAGQADAGGKPLPLTKSSATTSSDTGTRGDMQSGERSSGMFSATGQVLSTPSSSALNNSAFGGLSKVSYPTGTSTPILPTGRTAVLNSSQAANSFSDSKLGTSVGTGFTTGSSQETCGPSVSQPESSLPHGITKTSAGLLPADAPSSMSSPFRPPTVKLGSEPSAAMLAESNFGRLASGLPFAFAGPVLPAVTGQPAVVSSTTLTSAEAAVRSSPVSAATTGQTAAAPQQPKTGPSQIVAVNVSTAAPPILLPIVSSSAFTATMPTTSEATVTSTVTPTTSFNVLSSASTTAAPTTVLPASPASSPAAPAVSSPPATTSDLRARLSVTAAGNLPSTPPKDVVAACTAAGPSNTVTATVGWAATSEKPALQVVDSRSAPAFGQPSGQGVFGNSAPIDSRPPSTTAIGKGGSSANLVGDAEMSTEQDEGNATSGTSGFFGSVGAGGLGLGGKADPEKAKLNPFGTVAATGGSGAAEAAKLFGSPARPSIFGAAPSFGSPAVAATPSIFGASPAMPATASTGSPASVFGGAAAGPTGTTAGSVQALSPFGRAGSMTPSVFGGGSTFGAASAHAQFGGPPAFGSGGSVFGGTASFGAGSSVFGGAPVFGALGGQKSFEASSPGSSVFGGQTQNTAGSASPAFGSVTSITSQPTFGMLAQQQSAGAVPTFGMMAQQPTSPAASVFGGAVGTFGSGSPGATSNVNPSFTAYRK